MLKKNLLFAGVYLAAAILSGCAGPVFALPTLPPTNTPNLPLITETVTETATRPPVPVTQTTTPTPVPTYTPTPTTNLVSCLNPNDPLPLDPSQLLPGTLFFREVPEPGKPKIIALDGSSRLEGEVVADLSPFSGRVSFSPSGAWLALTKSEYPPIRLENISLQLISADGETKSLGYPNLPEAYERAPFWITGFWFNDELIIVDGWTEDMQLALYALFDPFTETWRHSLLDYLPDRYFHNVGNFSPDLTRSLYITGQEPKPELVLWDVEGQKPLWREKYRHGLPLYINLPELAPVAWAADSSKVSFPLENPDDSPQVKIYTVTREGEAFLIRPNVLENRPITLSWSPDGRYLAFGSQFESAPAQRGIIIYDDEAKIAVDLCPIEAGDFAGNVQTFGGFAWSPDSRYLVYGKGGDFHGEDNQIVMLDLQTGRLTVLKQGPYITFVGWSAVNGWVKP